VIGTLLGRLGRHGAAVIAVGVFLGLALPPLAAVVRPLLLPAILLPFLVALLKVDFRRTAVLLRRPGFSLPLLVWLLLASPGLVWLVTAGLAIPPELRAALVTNAASAPLMASGALALILGLDVGLALLATVAATVILPLSLLPLALHLAGLGLEIDASRLALRLGLLIGGCFVLATLLRRRLGELQLLNRGRQLDGLAVLGLLIFGVAVMDGVAEFLWLRPTYALATALSVFALNAGLQVAGTLIFWGHGRRVALTVGLISGNNNIGIVLAALVAEAPVEFLVYVAMAQFPIYLLPALQKPLYARLLAGDEER